MKRIIKQTDRVIELYVNVRTHHLRVVEYTPNYVGSGSIYLDNGSDVRSILNDTYNDIVPYLRLVRTYFLARRNPYFSTKTGKPLSKWHSI